MAQLKDLLVSGYSKLLNTLTTQNILPNEDKKYDIGSSDKKYKNIYTDHMYGTAENALYDVNGNEIDSYYLPLLGGTMTGTINSQSIIPTADDTYDFGSTTSDYARIYSRCINARHLDSSIPYAKSADDYSLYLGYGSGNPTKNIYFYSSDGTAGSEAASRTLQAEINSEGLKVYNSVKLAQDINAIYFRYANSEYASFMSHQTSGNEALVLGLANTVTSFIVANGESVSNASSSRWQNITAPGLQVKNNCVSIGSLIKDGVTPTYKLQVVGSTYLNGSVLVSSTLGIAGSNSGYNLYNAGTSYLTSQVMMPNGFKTGAQASSGSGSGVVTTADGGIEIFHTSTPFIDFHFQANTGDYTSRIIESSKGYLNTSGAFGVGSSNTSYMFYVSGSSYLNGKVLVDGACGLASGSSSIYIRSGSSSSTAGAGIEFYDTNYRRFRITDYRGVLYIQSDIYHQNTGSTSAYKTPSEQYRLSINPNDGWVNLGITNPNYNNCINFDAFGNESVLSSSGTTTYTTLSGTQQGIILFRNIKITNTYATAGDTTSTVTKSISGSYFQFSQKSYNSSTYALSSYSEYYKLPTVTANLSSDKIYYIFTSKNKSSSTAKRYVTTMSSSTDDANLYYNTAIYTQSSVLYGAAWNDYAEYRAQKEEIQPGYCVKCNDDGRLYKTSERLSTFEGITSDTYGFVIGETEENKTPLAVAGRVLVYTYEPREEFHAGDCVCAGPDGKISKMSREEIREWPDRIIGIVSEIPDYKIWGTGNVEVNGRIWIKVR